MNNKQTYTYSLLRFTPKTIDGSIDGNCFAIVRYLAKRNLGSTVVLVSSLSRIIPLHAQLFVPQAEGYTTYEFRPRGGFVITNDVQLEALRTVSRTISFNKVNHYMSVLHIALSWLKGLVSPVGKSYSGGDERVVFRAYYIENI